MDMSKLKVPLSSCDSNTGLKKQNIHTHTHTYIQCIHTHTYSAYTHIHTVHTYTHIQCIHTHIHTVHTHTHTYIMYVTKENKQISKETNDMQATHNPEQLPRSVS